MLLKLFLAFTVVPAIEIYLFITVGGHIGILKTMLLVVATGFAGAYLARLQGLQTMLRVRQSLALGRMPTQELMDAVLILAAGLLLLTPGFLTDAVGLLLLFPECRRYVKQYLRNRLEPYIDARRSTGDRTL